MAGNSTPETAITIEEAYHPSTHGARIFSCTHSPAAPWGVVLLTHGLGEHSGRYGHVIHLFAEAGIATVRFDLRGHGRSDGQRGHAASFAELINDLSLVFHETRARFPALPIIVYGHSLGGNLVANWALRKPLESAQIAGMVLSAPWLLLATPPSPLKVSIIKLLSRIWPTLPIPARFRPKRLTRHRAAIDAYEHDPLIHRRVSVRLASEAFDAAHWALGHAERCTMPVFGLHGLADTITSPKGTEQFCHAAPNATLLLLPDLVHEPHNEPEWREVVLAIREWIVDRLQETQGHVPRLNRPPLAENLS